MIGMIATAVVAAVGALSLVPVPATQDWVVLRITDLKDTIDEKATELADTTQQQFNIVTQQILESRLVGIDGQIRQIGGELVDMTLRERATPTDTLIVRRKVELTGDLSELEREKVRVRCALSKARGFTTEC